MTILKSKQHLNRLHEWLDSIADVRPAIVGYKEVLKSFLKILMDEIEPWDDIIQPITSSES